MLLPEHAEFFLGVLQDIVDLLLEFLPGLSVSLALPKEVLRGVPALAVGVVALVRVGEPRSMEPVTTTDGSRKD